MKRLSCLIISFTLGLTSIIRADPGDRVKEMVLSMPSVYKDSSIELRSDEPAGEAASWAVRMKAAYNFDRSMQGLESVRALDAPIMVGLASDATILKYMRTTMGGRAVGLNMFASHSQIFRDHPAFGWFIAAHELEHLEMHRLHANEPEVPVYIFEGIACSLGDRYVMQFAPESDYLRQAVAHLNSYTSADATEMIRNFRLPSDIAPFRDSGHLYREEHLGGLFIEFLLARSGRTPESFFRSFGEIWKEVGNHGSFQEAFQSKLGLPLTQAEDLFVAFMRRTQAKPRFRFRHTMYEQVQAAR